MAIVHTTPSALSFMIDAFYQKTDINPAWLSLRSQGYSTVEQDASLPSLAEIPPFLRTLLITDGTVTRSLESFFWEPVSIQQLALHPFSAAQAIPWLCSTPGEELLIREVRLVGQHSQKVYTTAYSIIRLQQVPTKILKLLIEGGIGIGVLISEFGVESYREILDIGYSQSLEFKTEAARYNQQQPQNNQDKQSQIVYRTYRILVEKEPTILITEKFPMCVYQSL